MAEVFNPLVYGHLVLDQNFRTISRILNNITSGEGIPTTRITDDAIDGTKIADASVDTEHLVVNAVTAAKIEALTITAAEIATGTITADKYYELRNTYVFSDQDSLDASYPFEMDFEIVSEMTAIQKVLLSFRIRNFRAYATTVPSGGGHTTPSGGGHTTPSGGGATSGATGSASGGGSTSGSQGAASGGGSTSGPHDAVAHDHTITQQGRLTGTTDGHDHSYYGHPGVTGATKANSMHTHSTPNHTHPGHTHSTPNHTHPNHTHTTPSHQHTVSNHTHTVSNHTHSLTFGIYEDSQSPTIHYHIDNGAGYGAASANYNSDQLDLDITALISGTGFKRIKFDSDLRTRISGWVLCKVDLTA